jgi:uncharacterized protein (UPF0332 family)
MSAGAFLEKAVESLKAAQTLIEQDCADSSASRCYYAAFHAARAALIHAGVGAVDQRWSHEAIQGDFSQLIHRRKVYPVQLLDHLRLLQDLRLMADYRTQRVSLKTGRRAVKMAEEFVTAVRKVVPS